MMSDTSRPRFDPAATKRWAERLARFHAGSGTVVAFCAAEGVSESNFYLWRRRLARSAPSAVNPPAVVPIRITPAPRDTDRVDPPVRGHRPLPRRHAPGTHRRRPAGVGGATVLTVPPATKLWFAPAVDLRLGFDGLANLVRRQLNADPLSGHLFVFTNRSADRVKVLYWGGHGLCLWCQRLEAGRYHFPEATAAGIELTATQFAMILDGIDLSRVRRFKRFSTPPPGKALPGS
jgi:transposase